MMMELIKLFDQHKDSLSVKKLLNKCKSAKEFTCVSQENEDKSTLYRQTVKHFDDFLEEKTDTLTNLIARRDKYYMHNDGNEKLFFDIQTLRNKYPFSFREAEELLSEAKLFCSTLYKLSTDKEWKPLLHQKTLFEHPREFSGLKKLLAAVKTE